MPVIPRELTALFPASREDLFDFARCQVNAAQLREIARADHGWGAEEVLPVLRAIADRGQMPAEIPSQLREVLQLTVYSEPDHPNPPPHHPGPSGRTGHQTRLFACTVLMYVAADSAIHDEDVIADYTLASALKSALVLGPAATTAMGRFLTWRTATLGSPEPVLASLAILIFALAQPPISSETFLEPIADWVLATDAEFQQQVRQNGWREKPPLAFSLQQGAWQPLEAAIRAASESTGPTSLKEKLQLCALLLAND